MDENKAINIEILDYYPAYYVEEINNELEKALSELDKKIIVLDDDPTGVQTVHGINVLTGWTEDMIKDAFEDEKSMFFIMINSRGLSADDAEKVNEDIAKKVKKVSEQTGKDYIFISRSDSTLRGHYPLETETLKHVCGDVDGEIIVPFFVEGGRLTINNIHYVKTDDVLIPAGQTEFAKDKTFGYTASHLGKWCEEKTKGKYKETDVTYITLEELRAYDVEGITNKLVSVKDFNKIIVNAISYEDIKVFCIAYVKALQSGKSYIFRSAAGLTKILGGVKDKPLLSKAELVEENNDKGGVVIVGSYVNKTTMQLNELKNTDENVEFIEFDTFKVISEEGLKPEVDRIVEIVEKNINIGRSVVVYTRREFLNLKNATKYEQLKVQVEISDAVTSIVEKLSTKPKFIIAKGGITSSDVGTKALKVKKALVMGQILPGIPVWLTDEGSKFPKMPYVIFPGNVGSVSALKEAVEILV